MHRQLSAVVGAGPLALARAQRAQTARLLLETTELPMIDVASSAGFRSVRQFNATVREIFATTPRELRARGAVAGAGPRRRRDRAAPAAPRRRWTPRASCAFLGRRAVPGVEEIVDGAYRRSLRLPHGAGIVELRAVDDEVRARFWLTDLRDLAAAVQRSRVLLDLDSDPEAVAEALGADATLGALVSATPGPARARSRGRRRAGDPRRARTAGVARRRGRAPRRAWWPPTASRSSARSGAVTHLFPSAAALAAADRSGWPMPGARRAAVRALAGALAARRPGPPCRRRARGDPATAPGAIPGIGPWTVGYVAMRALRDPDAFLPTDLGVRHALELLGRDAAPAAAERLSSAWRPYRVVRGAASLGSPGRATVHAVRECEARGMSRLVYTRTDSPIGELLLTGDGRVAARAPHAWRAGAR